MIIDEERQFNDLLQAIQQQHGLDCRQYKISYLKRRLAVRMRATGKTRYIDYKNWLLATPGEYDLLLDRLTINVSNFFRDQSVYSQIQKLVIPQWSKISDIEVWSAGCANGEEPYSLAMLFSEVMPRQTRWRILASDIDPTVLANARIGKYRNDYLKILPQLWKLRHFEPLENGAFWQAKPELKRNIQFQILDLTGKLPARQLDLIVCRNVLIYFISELQERLFKAFYDCLRPGGFLVLGKTETLLGSMRDFYTTIDLRERIYRKKTVL